MPAKLTTPCHVVTDRPDVLLVKLAAVAKEAIDQTYAPLGLRCPHTTVLQLLAVDGPCSQRILSEQLLIDRTTMVLLIDDLERAGLVERRPDPDDRRAYAVSLTEQGHAQLLELNPLMAEAQERIFAPLSPRERAELQRLLLKLARAGHLPGFRADQ